MSGHKNGLLAIVLILIVQFVVTFEMNVVMPLAPFIAELYEIPYHQVTYMNIGYAFFGMFAPIIGYNADRVGLKKMILFSLLIFAIGSTLIANVPSLFAYVIGRSFMGLSFFTMLGIGLSYLSLLVKQERLGVVSGLHRVAFGLGVFISPLVGTYLAENIGFYAIYQILSITMFGILIILVVSIPDIENASVSSSIHNVSKLVKGEKERKMMTATFLMSLPAIFFFNYLSVHLNGLGYTSAMIANIYTTIAAGSVLGGVAIISLADRVGKAEMLVFVSTIAPIVLIMFYFSSGIALFLFGLMFGFLFDSATGLLFPVGSMLVKQYKATFLTLLSLTMSFVNVVSNIIGPTIYAFGGFALTLGIVASGIAISSFILRYNTAHLRLKNH
jgi:predicted MFS family arabinose efflux permease